MCCLFDEAYDERNIPVNADLKIKGGGHPDPEMGGGRGGGLQNKFLGPSGLSLVEELEGGRPLLDPSLKCNPTMFIRVSFIFNIERGKFT